jgi:hypothetical protein
LPSWLHLACAHPEAYGAVERYLRYLAPGLGHLGPEPLRLVVYVVAPDDVPEAPPGASALAARDCYVVARAGAELIYSAARRGCVRIDPGHGAASIWTSSFSPDAVAELVSIAVLELASHRGFFGIHAGAVARDGVGFLLPGGSGSGKTSLCLTLMRAGFRYLTDDFVFLKADDALRCVPVFRTFNVDASWASRFPELSFLRDVPPLPQGKRMFNPERCYPGSHAASARPAVLVFPTIVTHPDSEVRRLSKREAFCRLLPQARLSADACTAEAHVRILETLVRDSDSYELRHGHDFLLAPVATLGRLLESLGFEMAAPANG